MIEELIYFFIIKTCWKNDCEEVISDQFNCHFKTLIIFKSASQNNFSTFKRSILWLNIWSKDAWGETLSDDYISWWARFNQSYLKPARAFYFKDLEVPDNHSDLFIPSLRYEIYSFHFLFWNCYCSSAIRLQWCQQLGNKGIHWNSEHQNYLQGKILIKRGA